MNYLANVPEVIELAGGARSLLKNCLIFAGGHSASFVAPELLEDSEALDCVLRGEGEGATPELLEAAGAQTLRGDLEDLESLRGGTAATDAVVHTAFRHDWSKFAEACELDKRAIETIGAVLRGSSRPFIVSSGVGKLF